MIKRKNRRQKNITSKDNHKYQDVGHEWLEEIPGHVNQVSIENYMKLNLGVMI